MKSMIKKKNNNLRIMKITQEVDVKEQVFGEKKK